MALEDMLEDTSLAKEFLDILEEYEKRESIEAKIVKDADNLDVDMELREQAANGVVLAEVFSPKRQHVAKTKLYTDTAREIYAAMQENSPHDWHLLSPHNRVNGGDWKK
jgi:5'-deoxynucleotidase YfbR-like HD superfamily hydrolase